MRPNDQALLWVDAYRSTDAALGEKRVRIEHMLGCHSRLLALRIRVMEHERSHPPVRVKQYATLESHPYPH